MIELQRQGLIQKRDSASTLTVAVDENLSDPEESEDGEEGGWEGGDEGRWSSDGGEKGEEQKGHKELQTS